MREFAALWLKLFGFVCLISVISTVVYLWKEYMKMLNED